MCKRIFIGLPKPITIPPLPRPTVSDSIAKRRKAKAEMALSQRERATASVSYKVTPQGSIYQPLPSPDTYQLALPPTVAPMSEDASLTWAAIDQNDNDQQAIGSRFTLPFVYEVWPLHECSCALQYSREDIEFEGFETMPYDLQQSAHNSYDTSRHLVRALGTLLEGELAAAPTDYVEVYVTWYGNESDPALPSRTVTPAYFGSETKFMFVENEPLRVEVA